LQISGVLPYQARAQHYLTFLFILPIAGILPVKKHVNTFTYNILTQIFKKNFKKFKKIGSPV